MSSQYFAAYSYILLSPTFLNGAGVIGRADLRAKAGVSGVSFLAIQQDQKKNDRTEGYADEKDKNGHNRQQLECPKSCHDQPPHLRLVLAA